MPNKGEKNREVIKYNSTEDLVNEKRETTFQLPFPWTGSGHVVYNNCLYYVTNVKNRIIRYDFGARRMKKQNEIVDALLGEECNYENNEHSEIELAVDETGLWVSFKPEYDPEVPYYMSHIQFSSFPSKQLSESRYS